MTRQDPGHTSGTWLDHTPRPDCRCGHIAGVHTPRPSQPKIRAACTLNDPDPCGCRLYQPDTQEDTHG